MYELIVFLFGLLFGSFANVLILRIPDGESIVTPRSHCPQCDTPLRWYELVPVFSFIFLRAKCSTCHKKISWRYPLVELINGILFVLVYRQFGFTFSFFEYCLFVYCLLVVSVIDLDHYILPDVFTLSGIVIGLAGAAFSPDRTVLDSIFGLFLGGGILWALAALYTLIRKEEGLGGGDIKLMAWIGAVLGWQPVPIILLAASIFGSCVGLLVARKSNQGMKTMIPFGPFLALGAVLQLIVNLTKIFSDFHNF